MDVNQLHKDIQKALPLNPIAASHVSNPESPRWQNSPDGHLLLDNCIYVTDINNLRLLSSGNSGNSEVSSEGSESDVGQRARLCGELRSSGLVFRAQRNLASTFKKLHHALDLLGVPNFRGRRLVIQRKLIPTQSIGVVELCTTSVEDD